jgi:hypothetical protein
VGFPQWISRIFTPPSASFVQLSVPSASGCLTPTLVHDKKLLINDIVLRIRNWNVSVVLLFDSLVLYIEYSSAYVFLAVNHMRGGGRRAQLLSKIHETFRREEGPQLCILGRYEAVELRDNERALRSVMRSAPWEKGGVLKAVANVTEKIAQLLLGMEPGRSKLRLTNLSLNLTGTENMVTAASRCRIQEQEPCPTFLCNQ